MEIEALEARVVELETALARLRGEYDERLTSLEDRLAALQISGTVEDGAAATADIETAAPVSTQSDVETDRERLERQLTEALASAAPEAAAPTGSVQDAGSGSPRFTDRSRNLRELNPEISVTGDMFGVAANRSGDPEVNQFRLAEFELALQAPLDPYSQARAFIVQEDGEFEIEEAYIDWTSLPGGFGIKAGALRNEWGKLNRWHQHSLPQADRPLVHQAFLGEDGLRGLGVSVSWLAPSVIGDYNEVLLQVVNDENDAAFSGRGFDAPVFVIHETNYWDLSNSSYFELGLSAATGVNDESGDRRTWMYGADWSFGWQPPAEALYKGFELRGEVLHQRREAGSGTVESWGAYTYGTYKLDQRWFLGLRADWTELPAEPGESIWGISPYVEWWQSEWARLRLQYSHNSRRLEEDDPDHRVYFQITWALGPHKHEKY